MPATRFDHQRGHHLLVDGASLYVEEIGNPEGSPLLLLHGGFGNIETFNPITPALADKYRLIGIDSRGQGKSSLGTRTLSYRQIQQDVEEVVHQLGLTRYGVIGFSDGGIVALRLAANPSNPVQQLVTIGAHWHLAADDPTRQTFAGISTEFWRKHFPEEYERYHALSPAPDFDDLVERVSAMWLDDGPDGYPGETIRAITAPVLVVHGEDDPVVLRSNPLDLVARVKGARLLWLPMTGHAAHEERPDWVAPVVSRFLAQG